MPAARTSRWTLAAISARSCRPTAFIVTGLTSSTGKPICGSTLARRPSAPSTRRLFPVTLRPARRGSGSRATIPTCECRLPIRGRSLPTTQRDLIRRWIEQGAQLVGALGLRPAAATGGAAGSIADHRWPPGSKNPIDAFVLRRLQQEGLHPSEEASRSTWIRRATLDLIGLPPSPEEVDAFLADESADAYDKVIARLLRSQHYGERWGRVWLDAARYADSDGYEKDKPREVWFYRDWVINALNADMPYDQFIIQQIAGDLLPGAGQDERVATGFLRNSMINEEGGADPEQFRMEAMFDRMDAIGKAVLGMTINCAQCHSHKYDPLTQEDYYRMFAFLNNSHETQLTVYTPEEQEQIADLRAAISRIDQQNQRRPSRLASEVFPLAGRTERDRRSPRGTRQS